MSVISAVAVQNDRSTLGQELYDELQALPAKRRVSSAELERVYGLAYAYVTQGQYSQALPIFRFLMIYSPSTEHYLAGLGICLQMCEAYDEAIDIYSLLGVLSPGNLASALQVAECQLMLGRSGLASEELDRVSRAIAETEGRYDALTPRVLLLQSLVKKAS